MAFNNWNVISETGDYFARLSPADWGPSPGNPNELSVRQKEYNTTSQGIGAVTTIPEFVNGEVGSQQLEVWLWTSSASWGSFAHKRAFYFYLRTGNAAFDAGYRFYLNSYGGNAAEIYAGIYKRVGGSWSAVVGPSYFNHPSAKNFAGEWNRWRFSAITNITTGNVALKTELYDDAAVTPAWVTVRSYTDTSSVHEKGNAGFSIGCGQGVPIGVSNLIIQAVPDEL